MKKWDVVESKVLVESPWITFRKDRCILPDGTEIPDYYWWQERDFAVVFGVTTDNKVVLVEQYRHGIKDINLELPAGLIDEGEEPINAAKRELLEETGFLTDNIKFQRIMYYDAGKSSKKGYLFFAKNLINTGSQCLDQTECINIKLIDFDKIIELINNGTIKSTGAVAAILLALQEKNWFFE